MDSNSTPDAHTQYASELFGVTVEEVTPKMRYEAKKRSFLRMYGTQAEPMKGTWRDAK